MHTQPVALTIAGSDSGGGAGIQADLKTFAALDVFGASAVTCVTAQNPTAVTAVYTVDEALVRLQILASLLEMPVKAAKTGMLYSPSIVEAVADTFKEQNFKNIVVDPVMISSSGTKLLRDEALEVLEKRLLPLAKLIMPNLGETEVLTSRTISTVAEMEEAARYLADRYQTAVLVKGGHLPNASRAVDVLFDGTSAHQFSEPFIDGLKTHGTGCVYSAAVTGYLAHEKNLVEAIGAAKKFVTEAIRQSVSFGAHSALNPLWQNNGHGRSNGNGHKRNGNGNGVASRPATVSRPATAVRQARAQV
jgi:hydroxymethylpyrimidine/phosphomethylpyrimidine kinase